MSLEAPVLFTHDMNQVIVSVVRRKTQEEVEIDGINGDGIQLVRTEPKYADLDVSSDGKIAVRTANNNRSGKLMITGTQYSPMHKQWAILDMDDPDNDILDITVSDLSNKLLYACPGSYLSKFADANYADAKGDRTHEVTTPWMEMDKEIP